MNTYPQNDWRNYIEHSAKGQKWKKHKYIAIENGRYIYPKDLNTASKMARGYRRPESLSDALYNANKFERDRRFVSSSLESRRRFPKRVNAIETDVVPSGKLRSGLKKSVRGRIISLTPSRSPLKSEWVKELDQKATKNEILKRRQKLRSGEAARKQAATDAEMRKTQNLVDKMFYERNGTSPKKHRKKG